MQDGAPYHNYRQTEQDTQYQDVTNREQEMRNRNQILKSRSGIIRFTIPETEEATELSQLLNQNGIQPIIEPQSFFQKIQQKYNDFEEKFESYCTCRILLNQLIITIVYWSTFFSVLSESIAIQNSQIIENDKIRQQLAQQLPVYAFLYTISSQICQQRKEFFLWIVLFGGLIITPTFVLIGYHLNLFGNHEGFSEDYIGVGYCILSISIFINSLVNRGLLYFIQKVSSALIATLFNCSFCVLISYFILFKIVAFILLIQSTKMEDIMDNITSIIAPSTFLVIFGFSFFLLRGLFYLRQKTIKQDLYQLSLYKYADEQIKEEYLNYKMNKKAKNIFKKLKLEYIVPIFISICYATIEIICYIYLILGLQSYEFEQIITFGFLLIGTPIFMILGIVISNSRIKKSNLYLFTSLLFSVILSVICIKVWSLTFEIQYIKSISRLIGICPLIISLMWLTVAFFRSEKKYQKLFVMFFSCFSFALPLGIFLTFQAYFDDENFYIAAIVLICIGIIPIIFLIIYYLIVVIIYLIKLPQQAEKLLFYAYEYVNLKNYGVWYNSICYILSFYFICYFAWNEPITATGTKKGTIIGLLSIHSILFILTNHALSFEAKEKKPDIDEIIPSSQKLLNRVQDSTLIGILLPLIVLLPIGVSVDNEVTKNALIANAIGLPLSFLYYKYQISLKQESVLYQDFIQPLVVILVWTFIIGPIGTLFPILADYYENSSEEFALFAQLAVAYTILIIIISVTIVSIFYSVLLNKEQLEMKKKEVLKVVMKEFSDNGVYATEEISSLLFVRYVQHRNAIKLQNDLIKGDPVNMYEHPDPSENKNIKNILVTKQDYENKMKLEQLKERKRQSSRKTITASIDNQSLSSADTTTEQREQSGFLQAVQDCLFSCLLCKLGYYELEEIESYKVRKEEVEKEIKKEKIRREKQIAQKIRSQKRNSTILQLDKIENDQFLPLKNTPQRSKRFWSAVYQFFNEKNDFTLILEILALEYDTQTLQQYQSFQQKDEKFTLNEEDFALLIYDNFREENLSYIEILQKIAVDKYSYFLQEIPNLKQLIRDQNEDDSIFSKEILDKIKNLKNDERKKLNQIMILRPIQGLKQDQIQEQIKQQELEEMYKIQIEYQIELDELNKKYRIQRDPSECEIKLWKICKSIHTFIWITPKKYTQKFMNQLADLYSKIAPLQPKEDPINEDWKKIAPLICNTLIDEFNKFDRKSKEQEFDFKLTITNFLAVFLRCYDLYGLITLAFDSQVGWLGNKSEFKPIKMVDYSAIWSEYNFFFFMAMVMSIAYIVLGIQASKQIADNSFGYDQDGQIAGIKSLRFWLSKTIQIISGQFIFVMKTYIDAFICDYSEYPYTLVRQPSVECMSDFHFLYISLAIIGCGIYYPLSTYLQPTFQFMDRSLDLKYKSNFVVLYIQAKLLILGSSSVFSNLQESAYQYQMLLAFLVMAGLVYFHFKLNPSYIKWFNTVDRSMLLILCYFYFGAFVIMLSKSVYAGWAISLTLTVVTLAYLLYFLIKEYRTYRNIKVNQVRPVVEQ